MAENIGSNDLSSIDALLDEAELENLADDQGSDFVAEESAFSENESSDLDEAEELFENTEEPVSELEERKDLESSFEPEASSEMDDSSSMDAEQLLEQRANSRREQQPNQVNTVENMNEVKSLVAIFGSIIIFLALAAVGVSLWGALSSGGIDEETLNKFDNIELAVTGSLLNSNETSKTLKELEKKLDGLSFQIKQLDDDLLASVDKRKVVAIVDKTKIEKAKVDKKVTTKDKSKEAKSKKQELKLKAEKVAKTSTISNLNSSEMVLKIDKVSAKMSNAQRRIYEINKRVKSLQSQYKRILKSVKNVERHTFKDKLKKAKEKSKSKDNEKVVDKNTAKGDSPEGEYQYTSPGGMFNAGSEYYR